MNFLNAKKTLVGGAAAVTLLVSNFAWGQSLAEPAKGSTVTGTKVKSYGEAANVAVEGSLASTLAAKGKGGLGPVSLEGGYSETKGAQTGQFDNGVVEFQGSTITNSEFDVTGKAANVQVKAGGTFRNGSAYAR